MAVNTLKLISKCMVFHYFGMFVLFHITIILYFRSHYRFNRPRKTLFAPYTPKIATLSNINAQVGHLKN